MSQATVAAGRVTARRKSARDTTSSLKKRKNAADSVSHREDLRVAVIDRQNPQGKLTEEQRVSIEEKLKIALKGVISEALKTKLGAPIFEGFHYSGQILHVTCGDERSLNWLKDAVAHLPDLWKEAKLEVVQVNKLPRLFKATLWVPGKPEPTEEVIRWLTAQNTWTKVNEWMVIHDRDIDDPYGKLIYFGFNEQDKEALESRKGKLNFGFSTLKVKVQCAITGDVVSTPTAEEVIEELRSRAMNTDEDE